MVRRGRSTKLMRAAETVRRLERMRGKMEKCGLTVSTDCPTCGAPLDFLEGSNSVQCTHCKSNLLVTGRKQVLSYFVRPKLDIHRAVAKTMLAHKEAGKPCHVVTPQLYFIPYYRLTGHDFRWETAPLFSFQVQTKGNPLEWVKESTFSKEILSGNDPLKQKSEVFFQDQYVEKNFIGLHCNELGVYSLGVRPAVLKLELFVKTVLESLGKVVKPDLSPEEAFDRGMKTVGGENLLFRQVLGWMLSLVYFPFWIVEVETGGEGVFTILDAVSESVIQLKVPLSLKTIFQQSLSDQPQILQFRPLSCPNCGWDLPVRKDDVIFFCHSCEKAWQISGNELSQIPYQIIKPPDFKGEGALKYLPIWMIETDRNQTGLSKYFLPGFRYRRLKILADLAANLSQKSPPYSVADPQKLDACGCYYDQEDAANLAKVTQAGMILKAAEKLKQSPVDQFKANKIFLSWIPFHVNGETLIEPFTGMSLSQSLLV